MTRQRPDRPWSVLISEGGRGESRAAVAATRVLSAEGYSVTVTMSDRLSLAASSRHCDRRLTVPSAYDYPDAYAAAVRAELARGRYLAVLPVTDYAIAALGAPGAQFLNKASWADRAEAAGLAVPPAMLVADHEQASDAAAAFDWWAVVKPDVKRTRARIVRSPRDIAALPSSMFPAIVQPYLREQLGGVLGLMWDGRLVTAAHLHYRRVWPRPCGTIASGVTVAPDPRLEAGLERLLQDYQGVFHVDLAGDYLLDVNPRVHASLPVAMRAGSSPVADFCALLRGRPVSSGRARAGVEYRWVEGDLRSLAFSLSAGDMRIRDAVRDATPRRGRVHSFGSLRDPGPSLARLGYVGRRIATGRVTEPDVRRDAADPGLAS